MDLPPSLSRAGNQVPSPFPPLSLKPLRPSLPFPPPSPLRLKPLRPCPPSVSSTRNPTVPGNYFFSVTQTEPADSVDLLDSGAQVTLFDEKGIRVFKVRPDQPPIPSRPLPRCNATVSSSAKPGTSSASSTTTASATLRWSKLAETRRASSASTLEQLSSEMLKKIPRTCFSFFLCVGRHCFLCFSFYFLLTKHEVPISFHHQRLQQDQRGQRLEWGWGWVGRYPTKKSEPDNRKTTTEKQRSPNQRQSPPGAPLAPGDPCRPSGPVLPIPGAPAGPSRPATSRQLHQKRIRPHRLFFGEGGGGRQTSTRRERAIGILTNLVDRQGQGVQGVQLAGKRNENGMGMSKRKTNSHNVRSR